MVEQARAAVPGPPLTVTIQLVDSADAAPPDAAAVDGMVQCRRCHWRPLDGDRVTRCYRCGATAHSDHGAPWCSPIADRAQTPSSDVLQPDAGHPTPASDNVVKLRARDSRTMTVADWAPPKIDYSAIDGGSNGNPFSVKNQPKPNFSAGHTWPIIE
jgi:hypothetical protein